MSQDAAPSHDASLSIAAVERETGIAKDTLRVWEKRYGFPNPLRDVSRERLYPTEQVLQLKLISRLLDAGLRPGKIVGLDGSVLQRLLQDTADTKQKLLAEAASLGIDDIAYDLSLLLRAIGQHNVAALRHGLNQAQLRLGLAPFLSEVVGPLINAVGEGWARGDFEVYEEHLFTEVLTTFLRNTIQSMAMTPTPRGPRVLLTTLPLEQHGLGLLMVEAILALEDCTCTSLGTQTPIGNVVMAAKSTRADVVALSFTDIHHSMTVHNNLRELRSQLPGEIEIWVGGTCSALYQKPMDGIITAKHLEQLPLLVEQWRAKQKMPLPGL